MITIGESGTNVPEIDDAMRSGSAADAKNAGPILETLASTRPTTLACMHGSAWRADGGALLRELAPTIS